MASKETSDKTGYVTNVKIVDVEKRKNEGPKYYVYVLKVTWANPSNLFIIYRRYAQFFDLQCKLLDLFADTSAESDDNTHSRQIPFLPGKIILGRSQIRQIALERKGILSEYCQSLISLPERISRSRPILDFFHPTSTDVQQPIDHAAQEKKPIDKSSLVISEPVQLANYRCLADFTATEKLEMSLKRNSVVQVLQKHPNGWWFVQFGDQRGFVPGSYLEPSELKRGAREGKTIEKSLNETYVVNNTYKGTGKDELSLEQGSFVTVIEKSLTGWWKIKFNNQTGQFPAIYLSSRDGRHTPDTLLDDVPDRSFSKKKELVKANESDDDDDEGEDDYHMDPSKASEPELYYAHTDFNDNVGDCLSFKRGDIIEVHEKHPSGWWFGRRMKGDPILSWVPAKCLQKEPIMGSSAKSNNTLPFNPKLPAKPPEKISHSPAKVEPKEEKAKISTNPVRKNFEGPPSTNHADQSKVIKKQQPVETSTASKNSSTASSTTFRPVNDKKEIATVPLPPKNPPVISSPGFRPINDKKETTTAFPPPPKNPPVISSPLLRPVGVKTDTTATIVKSSPISAPTAFRRIDDKQEIPTPVKTSSAASSSAFRPVNNKPEPTSASKNFPSAATGTSFRPAAVKPEPVSASKNIPSAATGTSFRPAAVKPETTGVQKKFPVANSTTFRPLNDKHQSSTPQKKPSLTTSVPHRSNSADNKRDATKKSVKDLVGKYNH